MDKEYYENDVKPKLEHQSRVLCGVYVEKNPTTAKSSGQRNQVQNLPPKNKQNYIDKLIRMTEANVHLISDSKRKQFPLTSLMFMQSNRWRTLPGNEYTLQIDPKRRACYIIKTVNGMDNSELIHAISCLSEGIKMADVTSTPDYKLVLFVGNRCGIHFRMVFGTEKEMAEAEQLCLEIL